MRSTFVLPARGEDLRDTHAEALVHDKHLAARDEEVVDVEIDRIVGELREIDEDPGASCRASLRRMCVRPNSARTLRCTPFNKSALGRRKSSSPSSTVVPRSSKTGIAPAPG